MFIMITDENEEEQDKTTSKFIRMLMVIMLRQQYWQDDTFSACSRILINVMQKTRMTKDSDKDQDQVDYVYVGGGEGEYGEGMKIDNTSVNLIKGTNTGAFDTGQSCCLWVAIFFASTPHLLNNE